MQVAPRRTAPEGPAGRHAGQAVPWPVRVAAAWAWRLLLVAAAVVLAARALADLRLVVLPLILALFLTTLLAPVSTLLRAAGLPRALAAGVAVLGLLGGLAGTVALLGPTVIDEFDTLGRDVRTGIDQVLDWLGDGPLGLAEGDLERALDRGVEQARANAGTIGSGVLSGAVLAVEVVAGVLVALVVTFFLLKDGDAMWRWFLGLFGTRKREVAEELGARVWSTLGAYLRGLVVVAAFDAVFIGLALWLIGVPLVLPLAVLTFLLAFIPIVGAVTAGAAAMLVALVAGGIDDALLVLVAVVVVQQVESEILYPVVVGKALRMHPVPVLVAVTAGGILYGVVGAALGAPLAAVATVTAGFARERSEARAPASAVPEGD